jgi:nitric oxide reductase large subunit
MNHPISQHLKRVFVFACVMIIVGLALGVYSREILRPIEEELPFERLKLLQTQTFLSHGHAIFYGALIPIALAFGAFTLRDALGADRLRGLNRAFTLMMVGAVLVLGLSLYKNTVTVVDLIGDPTQTWAEVDEALFGGSGMVRALAHTLAHPLLGVGIGWYVIGLWRTMRGMTVEQRE